MRGCLLLILGVVLGVLLLAVIQVLLVSPPALPQSAPSNADIVILLRNQFLTRELQAQLAQTQSDVSFHGLTVQTDAGQNLVLVGTAAVTGTPVTVPIRVVLRPTVVQNRVTIEIVQASLGTLKLPGSIFRTLEGPINQELNRNLANTTYRVESVGTTVEGLLISVSVTR